MLVGPIGEEGTCSTLEGIGEGSEGREDSAGGATCEVPIGGTGNTIENAEDEARGAVITELP